MVCDGLKRGCSYVCTSYVHLCLDTETPHGMYACGGDVQIDEPPDGTMGTLQPIRMKKGWAA